MGKCEVSTESSRNSANRTTEILSNINLTHLNRGGLDLCKSGLALLMQIFRKHFDYVFAVWEPD